MDTCRDLDGRKLTTTGTPFASRFGKRSEITHRSYVLPRTPREKEGSRPLEPGPGSYLSPQFLSSCGVSLQAGGTLNARLIRCVSQITVDFLSGAALETGAVNQGQRLGCRATCKLLIGGMHKF